MKMFEPNTTPTPNWIYDERMNEMTETELKVVLLVTRKTLGWIDPMTDERKKQDYISQSQFIKFTGKSHTSIAHAIQSCVKYGWIIAKDKDGNLCDTPEKRRRRKVWYQLGDVSASKKSKQHSCLDKNLSNILAKSKQHSCTHLSKNVDNTKGTITKETKQILSANADGVLNSTVNEIINSMKSSSGQQNKNTKIFNSKNIIKEMINDKQKHIQIIGIYWKWLDWKFENKEQYKSALGRDLKAASALKGYSLDRIRKTFKKLDGDSNNGEKFAWNLNTVHKTIDNIK